MSAEQFAQLATEMELLDHRQLQEIWQEIGAKQVTCAEFQQILLRRAFLTNYQAEKLLRGDRSGFFYGSYKVLYLVGTGTFARVYRAVHKFTGDIVAVKVLRRRFVTETEQAERFFREGQMGATLQHANIVPVREAVAQGENHYIVMDFVEGRNLREFIKIRKKLEPIEATRLITDVAAALTYAADRGIHHRDLKLSNVLVSSRGEAKLVDFGLAAAEDSTQSGGNPRTIDYAGLERATGVKKDDPRSDLYFLGCIYYHILSGHPALIETKDRTQRLSKTRFQNIVPVQQLEPTLPKAVITVITRALEFNPVYRYQSPSEMLYELRAAGEKLANPDAPEELTAAQRAKAKASDPGVERLLMFVESNVSLQNVFREKMKADGYRVLVTRDPDRAVAMFKEEPQRAELVIFSSGELGESALHAYNTFAKSETTAHIPAVLLLGEKHGEWSTQAARDERHCIINMPLKVKEFRNLMSKLLPPKAPATT